MNKLKSIILTVLVISSSALLKSQNYEDDFDNVESPYIVAQNDSGTVIDFPLKSTDVEVNISGNIAQVTIKQLYHNTSTETAEAKYVFPGSTRSAVYGLKMKIDDRTIVAEIKEKSEAKEIYEKAKQEGKTATLLEQHRPNVFEMQVGNILPNDLIEVTLNYTETIIPIEGRYEFVFPTVVNDRYVSKEDTYKDNWVDNPYAKNGSKVAKVPEQKFSLSMNINSPTTISKLNCPSHKCTTTFNSQSSASIVLDGNKSNNKDFIVRYELNGKEISSGLLLYEDKDEQFFMYTVQPPKRISQEEIPAREYIFILDVSGSMNGFPIDISKKMIEELLSSLTPKDQFNMILFANGRQKVFDEPQPATEDNIDDALNFINKQQGSGGTELLPALEEALDMSTNQDISKSVVILTDGLVSVEKEAFDIIEKKCKHANFFAFGIGTSINRYLLEGLAHIGRTDPIIVTSEQEAKEQATLFRKMISKPVLTNIDVDFGDFGAYDVEPSSYADLFLEKPILIYGKYKGKPTGKITVTGTSGKGQFKEKTAVSDYSNDSKNEALKFLWARKKIQVLSDYNTLTSENLKEEITALGLKYSLLTEFTSFVGVDSQKRDSPTDANKSKPLQNHGSGGVPEPHEWALIILACLFISYQLYKWKAENNFKLF